MKVDKELYRQAYQYYEQWNKAELADRAHNKCTLSWQEVVETYNDLWCFLNEISSSTGEKQRMVRLNKWGKYYARIQKMEAWSREHREEA